MEKENENKVSEKHLSLLERAVEATEPDFSLLEEALLLHDMKHDMSPA